jgi:hypothetical protein
MAAAISGSPEPKEFPDWVHLLPEGRIRCYADADDAAEAVKDDPTAVAVDTSNRRSGYLSFTLNPVPEVSYLDLHWPYGYDPDMAPGPLCALPYFLCVDENLLLICIVQNQYPRDIDLFVYTARASSPPSLLRLPACDKVIQDVAGRTFLLLDPEVGILRRGGDEGDFVVAGLAVRVKESVRMQLRENSCYDDPAPMMAVLCTFALKTGEWTVKEMDAPQPQAQDHNPFRILWSCDSVVPFAGRYLCCVDYYCGILIYDFSDEDSPCLNYVPFPVGGKQYSDETRAERNFPSSFRRVDVSQSLLRFIHIGDDYCQEAGGPCQTSELTITLWNLKMTDSHGNWDVLRVVKLCDLWAQPIYRTWNLPHHRLEFPVMTPDDPDVLCCVLRQKEGHGKAWVIMHDMKQNATVQSVIPSTTEEIKGGGIVQVDVASGDIQYPLIPSDFSKYLNNPPCK